MKRVDHVIVVKIPPYYFSANALKVRVRAFLTREKMLSPQFLKLWELYSNFENSAPAVSSIVTEAIQKAFDWISVWRIDVYD